LPFLVRLLGYPYDTLCGKHIWDICVFNDIAASKEAFQTLQDHEYIRYEDMPLKTHYGHPVDVEFVTNVYQVDNNRVIQCNIRDITERKRVEVRIRKGFQLESALLRIDTQILEGADTREVMGTACEAIRSS
jgi:PAS domain S-box-containing protein